jgi:prepilin-type N-terminal cleavage/methylation domain-containing protein
MKSCKGNGGFTLIEILVATTILLVIVILASLVFQQTTGAYDTGERKVGANVALRNVVGAISRDLALAVDSDEYEGLDNSWGGNSITFVAMTGKPGYDAEGKEDLDCRTPHLITYSANGTRTDVATAFQNGTWKKKGPSVTSKLYDSASFEGAKVEVEFFAEDPSASLPENVYIRAQLETEGSTSAVGAGSGGRRGWGSPDEIWVGVKP